MGGAIGAFASGYGWDYLGPAVTFSLASLCALAGLLILWSKLRLEAG